MPCTKFYLFEIFTLFLYLSVLLTQRQPLLVLWNFSLARVPREVG